MLADCRRGNSAADTSLSRRRRAASAAGSAAVGRWN